MVDWTKKNAGGGNVDIGMKTPASAGGPKSGVSEAGGGYKLPKGKTNRSSEASAISSDNGGGTDEKFAVGGKTPMFGEQNADEQAPGTTHHDTSPETGPGDKFASGGTQKMFGYSPSVPARAGITSAR
jgi:hypothetical protein